MIVPPAFAARFHTADELAWLRALPDTAADLLARWSLVVDGPPLHGWCALVLPVRTSAGDPAVLKITWPHPEAEHEALCLSTWAGGGAVRLLAAEPWALLLERLDPHHSLADEPLDEALAVVAGLLRRLDRPAPPVLRSLRAEAGRWVRELPDRPAPPELVAQAVAYCVELGPRAGDRLVNEDLHYENVLRAEREPWLVIDPKPLAGDQEFGLIPLLWNRWEGSDPADRLRGVVDAAGLDWPLARKWTFVRAVLEWGAGQDDDPAVAAAPTIATALV
ncbi:aminoglycoside phosphotransferase family protein [Actinokineospora bangkokensis]|uniref:Aminoglycoside phosphotransferase n=1 Tax=Actinokineospora bangkokensis TaxID=1193682 RepID=A0A1Q9LDL2_9PSEU|nr:aminoglycoside phosphotransferase family protein [Actinokineospora bangkokensis]OLR90120.1 hypothetical protein BJP25_03870 [Actinokineospora bangkokensis]